MTYFLNSPADESRLATEAEADAEYARNVGQQRAQQAWILSDRDVWYRNPAYTGPAVRHPEDDDCYDHDDTPCIESGRDNCDDAGTGEGQYHGRM